MCREAFKCCRIPSTRVQLQKTAKCWYIFDNEPSIENVDAALHQLDVKLFPIPCQINFEKKVTKCMKNNTKPYYAYKESEF